VRRWTDGQETCEGELAHGPGPAHRCRHGRQIEILQHRSGAGVDPEVLGLLSGVLDGEEHRFGCWATGAIQRIEQWHRLIGRSLIVIGEPLPGDGPGFVEVGGHHVHHLVEGRREGHFGGGDGRMTGVGGLKHAGVHDDLVRSGGGVGSQSDA
jgi:hypothetical protein